MQEFIYYSAIAFILGDIVLCYYLIEESAVVNGLRKHSFKYYKEVNVVIEPIVGLYEN